MNVRFLDLRIAVVQKYLEKVYFQCLLWREFGSLVGPNTVTIFVCFLFLFFFCGWEVVKVSYSSVNYMYHYTSASSIALLTGSPTGSFNPVIPTKTFLSNHGRVGNWNWKIPSICPYNSTKASSRKSNAITCAEISFQFHYWDWGLV